MLLIAEVDCHDVDHVLKLSSYIWLDCFRWHGYVQENLEKSSSEG